MGGGVRLRAWLIGSQPIKWRHSGLQNTWNFGAGDVLRSARMASCRERREEVGKNERIYCHHTSVFNYSKKSGLAENLSAPPYRPPRQATCPSVSHSSPLAYLKTTPHICCGQRGENSPQIHLVFESNMALTPLRHIFFCLSVVFPKFVSEKSLATSARDACRGPTKPV